jgi:phosphoribosylcarboxyaminoimidazole (NCAIR) mutase
MPTKVKLLTGKGDIYSILFCSSLPCNGMPTKVKLLTGKDDIYSIKSLTCVGMPLHDNELQNSIK